MTTRAEVAEKLQNAISEGNIREAYREFEELPIVDQLAISISPVVGDALAVYEVGEFGKRGHERAAERDFLGALGNYGIAAAAGLSLIPLFRLFRTARAAKNLDVVKAVEETESLKLEAPKVEEKKLPSVPKVKEFVPFERIEIEYPGTRVDGNPGLTSKAAKFINYNDKLPNQSKAGFYINKMKTVVPEGELRLLNILDETGEIHPKLATELEIRNPQDKITRQRLAEYIRSNQIGAIERKPISEADRIGVRSILKSPIDERVLSNVKESTFHLRGIDRVANLNHYSDSLEHKYHYVFDSVADFDPKKIAGTGAEGSPADIANDLVKFFDDKTNILNINRIQSDYAKEVGGNYADAKEIAKLKKGLELYNRNVPQVNKLASQKLDLQNSITESNLTPDSPSYRAAMKEIDAIDKEIADLTVNIDNFDQFTLSRAELERSTGKPFTETLPKSLDEIYYTLEPTGAGGRRQKYGPGTPLERATRYFDDLVTSPNPTFNLGAGISILKRATRIKPGLVDGYPIDPYVKGKTGNLRTNYTKLPVRTNFLKAVQEGRDGIYLDSGAKRLGKEGGSGTIIEEIYAEAESEISKILKELGVDPKDYIKSTKGVADPDGPTIVSDLDGTFVKIDDAIRELVEEKGIDAFKEGGPAISEREQEKMARAKKEEIKDAFQDVVGENFYQQYIEDTRLEDLYNTYKGVSDLPENIEQDLIDKSTKSFFSPFEDELKQIIKSDDPKGEILKMVDIYSTNEIDKLLQNLNLPIDVRKTTEGTRFGKDIYRGDKIDVDFTGYKPDDGDFRGDLKFKYANRTPFGDVSIQSMIDELGDVETFADYRYKDGPLQIRGQKRPGRDYYGDISYTLDDIDLGNNQKLSAQAIVNNLKNAALRIQYAYENPQSGAYLGGGLDLSNQRGPELQLEFGKRF